MSASVLYNVDVPRRVTSPAQTTNRATLATTASSGCTWYGMPAYARDGEIVCFFQSAEQFKSRYATFGFSDETNLDQDAMWPTSFALKESTAPTRQGWAVS